MLQSSSSSSTTNSSSVDDSIKVLVRIRPSDVTASSSTASSIPATLPKTLSRDANAFKVEENTVHEPKGNLAFTFDHVSKQNAAQSEIFDFCGQSSVDSYLEGYNATVFAYGQTGAGKTFTMQGMTGDRLIFHSFCTEIARKQNTQRNDE